MSDAVSATPRVELVSRIGTEETATTPLGKTVRSLAGVALFGVGYFLAARLGLGFRFQNSQIGVVWPPNALLLAALILTPRKSWWVVFATATVAHAMAMGTSVPAWRVAWQISADAAFMAAAAGALRRFIGLPLRFESRRDVLVFTGLSFVMPLLFAFTTAAFVLSLAGVETAYTPTTALARVLLSNMTALLIVTPAVVLGVRLRSDG